MDARKTAEAHLEAWQAGDAAAVAACAGTYADPDCAGPLAGEALAAHAATTLARFRNLSFEVDRVTGTGTPPPCPGG
ncbi:hypothetical protein [Nonomuraea recticatena]|uniref:hypothetical protein n=1 Tax=Nonomuraea recticatena TaxID=46178 RepID=UPI00361954B3